MSANIFLKILFSILLGALLGIEREKNDKPAGVRTIICVCLGATLFGLLSIYLPLILKMELALTNIRYDISRIFAYTIVSIGFLGGGVIVERKGNVEGVTTAAVLWVTVAIGLLCSVGLFLIASFVTFLVYIVLKLKYFENNND